MLGKNKIRKLQVLSVYFQRNGQIGNVSGQTVKTKFIFLKQIPSFVCVEDVEPK